MHVFCILKETSAYILSMVKVSMETLGGGVCMSSELKETSAFFKHG